MFCCNCGKEIGNHRFCPECGQPAVNDGTSQVQNSSSNNISYSTATAKKKSFPWKPIILGVAVILAGVFALNFMFGGSPERDAAIETVKNGYLGGYTDVTVEELMSYALGGMSDSEVIWDGGWTDDGEMIVEVRSEYNEGQSTIIQFKMLSEDTFKFLALKDPALGAVSTAKVIEVLNLFYYTYYMDQHGIDGAVAKLDRQSCGSVLCGSAATYKGNRKDLYMSAFDLERLTESAASYLGLLSENIAGDWQDSWSQRCHMTITDEGDNYYSVNVSWASSATENSEWTFSGFFEDGVLYYEDGLWTEEVYIDDEHFEYIVLDNMEGELYLEDDCLRWEDHTSVWYGYDFGSSDMCFERVS